MHTKAMTNTPPRIAVNINGTTPEVHPVSPVHHDALGRVAVRFGDLTVYMSIADAEVLRNGIVRVVDDLIVADAEALRA